MSLCPERDYRDSLTDEEFWAHVFLSETLMPEEEDDQQVSNQLNPCVVCGEPGACGYDSQGYPWVHIGEQEDIDAG